MHADARRWYAVVGRACLAVEQPIVVVADVWWLFFAAMVCLLFPVFASTTTCQRTANAASLVSTVAR